MQDIEEFNCALQTSWCTKLMFVFSGKVNMCTFSVIRLRNLCSWFHHDFNC